MQFPESWLRSFCNPPLSTAQLAELLTLSGMEVEELRPVAPPFDGIVVGAVLAVERHPNADRLNVCQVDAGTGSVLNIVCGAANVRVGHQGAVRAGRRRAAAGGRREVRRQAVCHQARQAAWRREPGMLCSARELKLSDDHGGLLVLPDDAVVGRNIREQLNLDDTLFTLKLTPNLAHGLSVFGVAREVAALTGAPLVEPAIPAVTVRHETTPAGARGSCRPLRPLLGPRRAWCRSEGGDAGVDGRKAGALRPAVGDGAGRHLELRDVRVRPAVAHLRPRQDPRRPAGALGRAGETLKLLNGNTVEVDSQVGVIVDDQALESLAGIMGGDATAVSDDTTNIFIEAAFWWPEAVAGRSRRFNFATDAGHRFERGVDPAQTVQMIERITALVIAICGGEAGPLDDQTLALPERQPVTLRVERAAKVIGMPVTHAQCEGVMRRLALPLQVSPGLLTVTPPSWRFDLRIEEDLIEEVIRVLGYASLPDSPPVAPVTPLVRSESRQGVHALSRTVAALGYQETINYSFVEARWEADFAGNTDPVRVLNPIAAPLSVMRSSLLGGLVSVLRFNLAHKAPRVRVFEAGRVFLRDAAAGDGPTAVAGLRQPRRLAGLAYGTAEGAAVGGEGTRRRLLRRQG